MEEVILGVASADLQNWKQSGHWFASSKGQLFVKSQGTGPVLLLIHGFPTSSWDWHLVFPELAKKFHVIAIDMLGYGFSDKPKNCVYSTSLQVTLINEVLQDQQIKSVNVMTYSYGVSVAQEMLRQQQCGSLTLSIDSICFMNGGLFPNSNHPRLSQKLLLGKLGWLFVRLFNKSTLGKNLRSIFGPNTQPSDSLIDQYWELINHNKGRATLPKLIQYLHERQRFMVAWEQALLNARCPIQLIIGDQDTISGVDVANEYRAKISEFNVHVLNDIGHYPQIEAPDVALRLYQQFLMNPD